MIPQNFLTQLLGALKQVLHAILKILLLPFNLWVKAISNLAEQKDKGSLDINKISGLWPFFTFCKRFVIDFLLDTIAFLAYPIGIFSAFVGFVVTCIEASPYWGFGETVGNALLAFLGIILNAYLAPVLTAFAHNILQFLLLPLRKLIDWLKKPAQHLDINSVQDVKVKKEE